jgi:SAM-dependent methyltransferase
MIKARNEYGLDHFRAVVGDALHLPFSNCSVDIVVYDFVHHHLVGQGPLETAVAGGFGVLRPGGFMISREPSSYSPSGLALNLLNHFDVMRQARLQSLRGSEEKVVTGEPIELRSRARL